MCSVIAGITALTTVASGVMTYQAQQSQAEAQAAAYEAQAKNYENQAHAAQASANQEAKKQEIIADNYAREGRELRDRRRLVQGQQRAQTGAAGIQFSGSALDILSAGNNAYAQDQMTLLSNQRNDNWSSRINQTNFLNDKASFEVSSRNAMKSAEYTRDMAKQQGLATILGTATSVAGGLVGNMGGGARAASSATKNYSFGNYSTDMGYNTIGTFNKGKYTFSQGKWF